MKMIASRAVLMGFGILMICCDNKSQQAPLNVNLQRSRSFDAANSMIGESLIEFEKKFGVADSKKSYGVDGFVLKNNPDFCPVAIANFGDFSLVLNRRDKCLYVASNQKDADNIITVGIGRITADD